VLQFCGFIIQRRFHTIFNSNSDSDKNTNLGNERQRIYSVEKINLIFFVTSFFGNWTFFVVFLRQTEFLSDPTGIILNKTIVLWPYILARLCLFSVTPGKSIMSQTQVLCIHICT